MLQVSLKDKHVNPIILTTYHLLDCSGHTEFVKPGVAYPIPVIQQPEFSEPILEAVSEVMRYVYSHQEEAKDVGQRGQQIIVELYNRKTVASIMLDKIETLVKAKKK